jgi:hypothetical protein
MRAVFLAVTCLGLGCPAATSAEAAAPPPRVTAILPSAGGGTLRQVDARTLRLVPGGWSRKVGKNVATALSPSGSYVAAVSLNRSVVLDTGTGRHIVRKYTDGEDASYGVHWLGADYPHELLVAVGFSCASLGCGNEFTVVGSGAASGFNGETETLTALRDGLVFAFDPTALEVYGRTERTVELPRMPKDAPFRVVSDVAHDRVFAISSAGLVAEIDHIARRPRVSYHRVDLNGRRFEAAWAGAGKIALWGADGLGTIDTRTWKTQAITPTFPEAVATRFGIAVRSSEPADGLTVYRPDGKVRFRVLVGRVITGQLQAVGEYVYVGLAGGARFSVNLSTAQVVGPLYSPARIIGPTLVPIP